MGNNFLYIYRPPLELGQSLVLVKFKIIILCNIYDRYLNTYGKNEFFIGKFNDTLFSGRFRNGFFSTTKNY